jgi:hypothetical protein
VFAWNPSRRALLVVEAKTLIVDIQDLLAAMDRKRRLAPRLARELGWRPLVVGTVLVLPDESRARKAVSDHFVLSRSYPARTWRVVRWLHAPAQDLRGIWFLSNSAGSDAKKRWRGSARVRRQPKVDGVAPPRVEVGPECASQAKPAAANAGVST